MKLCWCLCAMNFKSSLWYFYDGLSTRKNKGGNRLLLFLGKSPQNVQYEQGAGFNLTTGKEKKSTALSGHSAPWQARCDALPSKRLQLALHRQTSENFIVFDVFKYNQMNYSRERHLLFGKFSGGYAHWLICSQTLQRIWAKGVNSPLKTIGRLLRHR